MFSSQVHLDMEDVALPYVVGHAIHRIIKYDMCQYILCSGDRNDLFIAKKTQ